MAPFHTIASQSNHMQTYYSNNKKDRKLNIGYCSTKFRIESQIHSTAEYCKRKIQYMRQKPRAKLRLHVYKQAKLIHLILYTARHNIFILAHEKNYLKNNNTSKK